MNQRRVIAVTAASVLPAGHYLVQAVLNRDETYHGADGRVLKLPPDPGEGQYGVRAEHG